MIYLDYSANTPADEAVLQRFCEVERNCSGNANSRHAAGTAAKAAIDAATQSIARSLNVQPAEITIHPVPVKPTTLPSRASPGWSATMANILFPRRWSIPR